MANFYDTICDTILAVDRPLRTKLLQVLQKALEAVDPYRAVIAKLTVDRESLRVSDQYYDLGQSQAGHFSRVFVIGAGKAGMPMLRAVEDTLGSHLDGGWIYGGCVVVKDTGDNLKIETSHSASEGAVQLVAAAHPVPDLRGVDAARQIEEIAQQAGEHDLVIALISGGGSALLADVAAPISLSDLQQLTSLLLACGATINEINTLRKHCSILKGGQLARAVYPATLITLVLSDVVGSPLDVIASGPTVPDSSSWQDAWAVVEKYHLADQLPQSIRQRLQAGLAGEIEDTPKPGDPIFARSQTLIIADNRIAALAAKAEAEQLGYHTLLLSTFIEGEAVEVAKVVTALAKEVKESGHPLAVPACLILGGETTVTLGSGAPGKGGRNQELALAAALRIEGMEGVTIVSLATDGNDGPTDSAGGMVDGGTVARGRTQGLSAKTHLSEHNAYPFLQKTGDLLISGATQTNVNDLIFVFVDELA